MKKRLIMAVLLCILVVPFLTVGEADAVTAGWCVCDVVRIGVNAQHGFAYLELNAAGPNAGLFSNVIFQIDESIRSEALAAAMTSFSLGELIRVLITSTVNNRGYQVIQAVYTYVES